MIATAATPRPETSFVVPPGLEATLPPERRGIPRDGVRLLAATPARVSHHRFSELPRLLEPGDLVVVNTSATLPAALTVRAGGGSAALLHVSGWLDDSSWIVEVRRPDNAGPDLAVAAGDVLRSGEVSLTFARPHPDPTAAPSRLWDVAVSPPTDALAHLARHGRPIVYGQVAGHLPLSDHQTVYADVPGSAEMVSAGRPFTHALLARLRAHGVIVASLTLHAGVSSPEFHELPAPERYVVPGETARLVSATRAAGRRVIAVGTTVVRALETVADHRGRARGGGGWTDLVLGPGRPARVVTGLITGLHLPESSHLLLLEAVAGAGIVRRAYDAALERRYLWHEFGDSMLLMPGTWLPIGVAGTSTGDA
jgi:S-adenosylmethionine:tRNA ribosyltransferase-isomerase